MLIKAKSESKAYFDQKKKENAQALSERKQKFIKNCLGKPKQGKYIKYFFHCYSFINFERKYNNYQTKSYNFTSLSKLHEYLKGTNS